MALSLAANVIVLGSIELHSGPADPTAGGGVAAPIGSRYYRTDGTEYVKAGAGATAWTQQGAELIVFGVTDLTAAADTVFIAPGRSGVASNAAGIVDLPVPRAGTLKNLYVRQNQGLGDGDTVVYTIRVNNTPTTITVTLASNVVATSSDLIHTAAVAAGDRISLAATKALAITNGNLWVQASLELY